MNSIIMFALGLVWMSQIFSCTAQTCPNTYTYCAREGGRCNIPATAQTGYMSYGANGRFNLVPFSNYDNVALSMECDNDHGDILYGTVKYCCYASASIGLNPQWYWWNIREGGLVNFGCCSQWTWGMSYGTGTRYTYRFVYNALGPCTNTFFNDPVVGTVKMCKLSHVSSFHAQIPPYNSAAWTYCGAEGANCVGLSRIGKQWVRYGANNKYYFRLVISNSDGQVPCNNEFFEDPTPFVVKACWRAPATWHAEAPALGDPSDVGPIPEVTYPDSWEAWWPAGDSDTLVLIGLVAMSVVLMGTLGMQCKKSMSRVPRKVDCAYESDVDTQVMLSK